MKTTTINTLRKLEGSLRAAGSDVWAMTVDDPNTATVESEAAGMTPKRRALSVVSGSLSLAADAVESITNTILDY